jgi:hypothetical protein
MSKPKAKKGSGKSQFIMDDVKLLFNELTTPENSVRFDPPSRSNPATIQTIIHPPEIRWTWANQAARLAQNVTEDDLGKCGIQTDLNLLYELTRVIPLIWQAVQPGTNATWTWVNQAARMAQAVTQNDVGKFGIQTDIATLFRLTGATPPVWQPIPSGATTSSPFELSTGAADADSYHDFFRLQIAFKDVWSELLDNDVRRVGQELYANWDALMDNSRDNSGVEDRLERFPAAPPNGISGAEELTNFIDSLKAELGIGGGSVTNTPGEITQLKNDLLQTLQGCNMLLNQLSRAGNDLYDPGKIAGGNAGWKDASWLDDTAGNNGPDMSAFPADMKRQEVFVSILKDLQGLSPGGTQNITFPDIAKLLDRLDGMLKEPYRFDVFAPSSINYGLLLNYRQHWQPQSYQVGNLVSTIPLAPQETRRYTTKSVVKKTRNVKEIDDSVRSGKDESADTWRVDSEIVERAKNQTNFQKNASGSFGNDNLYKVSAGMQQGQDQAIESAQTKREFHESVVKSAQEYRNEHRLEITTEESREDETTSYREIRNPNDELTVTYLFYELQRRYLVDEALHKVTPVILVANEVPAPHEIDQAWLLRYDWIIRRTILDNSFIPALDYLSANYTGQEVALQVLWLAVEQQKGVVDKIAGQVEAANQALNSATVGLEQTEADVVNKMQFEEIASVAKSILDPIGINSSKPGADGNADRARVDFAKDALNRAQSKVNQLVSQLKTETTALQVAIDKYTKAVTEHFGMLADIDRLRIHVKDNIIYYMQAIWSYEPADQRYFRLYNLDVPWFTHNTAVTFQPAAGLTAIDRSNKTISVALPAPDFFEPKMKLHQVADIENLIGFKGNYMIFPMVRFNYMTWFMMQDYIHFDRESGVTAQDPDPLAGLTIDQLRAAMENIRAKDRGSFAANRQIFEEIINRLLSTKNPEMVIVPSNSLYIEALPGTHPLLEDFKLIHRAIDVKKAQAEARHAELENLRLAARLTATPQLLQDPDIEKRIVVEKGINVVDSNP